MIVRSAKVVAVEFHDAFGQNVGVFNDGSKDQMLHRSIFSRKITQSATKSEEELLEAKYQSRKECHDR